MRQPARTVAAGQDADAVVEHQTDQLRRRRAQLEDELDEHRRQLSATLEALRTVRGRGSAEDEAVVVVVDAQNRMVDLELDPRALRLGSIGRLRQAVLTATEAACTDAAAQLSRAGADEADADPDLLTALMDRMPEVTAMLGPELLAPPPTRNPGTDRREDRDDDAPTRSGTDPNPFE